MGGRVKKITAIALCMILCMTNVELYAAETDDVVSGRNKDRAKTATDEMVETNTSNLYHAESEIMGASSEDAAGFTDVETIESSETEFIEKSETETTIDIENAETETGETSTETAESETEETETIETETETLGTETEETETSGMDAEETETLGTETDTTETFETETFETEITDEQSEESVSELLSEIQAEVDRQFQADGYCASGYIDSGFEADRLGNPAAGRRAFGLYADRETLPSAYSAVEAGQVSAIRNQGAWGTCWSFAAMAAAESAYKKLYGKEADLSESHLVNFFLP